VEILPAQKLSPPLPKQIRCDVGETLLRDVLAHDGFASGLAQGVGTQSAQRSQGEAIPVDL